MDSLLPRSFQFFHRRDAGGRMTDTLAQVDLHAFLMKAQCNASKQRYLRSNLVQLYAGVDRVGPFSGT